MMKDNDLLLILLLCLMACVCALGQDAKASGSGTIVGSGGTNGYYTNWNSHPAGVESVFGGDVQEGNILGFEQPEVEKCEFMGRFDPKTGSCVIAIRFDKGLKNLVCSAMQDSEPIDDDEMLPKNMTKQITCMYDPK